MFKRIDWGMIWLGILLMAIAFWPMLGWWPLQREISWITFVWAFVLALMGFVAFGASFAAYLIERTRELIEAKQETVKILREYKTMEPEDKQSLQASRVVVEHLIINGARVDHWRWFGVTQDFYEQADVFAVWEDANLYRAPRVGIWGENTTRRKLCYDMVGYFAGNYWCESIEVGKATRWQPGGYEKARMALFGRDGIGG